MASTILCKCEIIDILSKYAVNINCINMHIFVAFVMLIGVMLLCVDLC